MAPSKKASKSSVKSSERKKVVLAYSGGLDTSVAIRWLQEKHDVDVIAVAVDVGQPGQMEEAIERAKTIGAVKAYAVDAKKEFAESYVFKALKANALYMGTYPMATSIARPLIAKILVDVAKKEKAQYIAHGCTAKGNDQVRFDVSIGALAPDLEIIAPMREWVMTREEEIEYARKNKIPIKVKKATPYSTDENLWGRSCECGCLEDAWQEPPEDAYRVDQEPSRRARPTTLCGDRVREGSTGLFGRQKVQRRGPDREAQHHRRGERRWTHRPGGGPPGGHQVQGDIRVTCGGRPDRSAQGPGEDGADQGCQQLQAHHRTALCRTLL